MNTTLRNIGAVIGGLVLGSIINSVIVNIGIQTIPSPAGTDFTTPEGIRDSMALMEPKHYVMPFLAHAVGTFVGAFVAAKLAATYKMRFAIGIGIAFLIGGISMVIMVSSPLWFTVADLLLAYIPMAYLAGRLAIPRNHITDQAS